jgi:hypothetical protein
MMVALLPHHLLTACSLTSLHWSLLLMARYALADFLGTNSIVRKTYRSSAGYQDKFFFNVTLEHNEVFNNYGYQSYFVFDGAKCENAKVLILYNK